MTQTEKDQTISAQKRGKPGQRQQERLLRLARRRRRQQIIISVIAALILIIAGITGIVQYQNYTADQQAKIDRTNNQHATATANANATASTVANATASVVASATAVAAAQAQATLVAQAILTATSGSPTPAAGPAAPPPVTGTPVTLAGGLQYIDIKVGNGPTAQAGSTVSVEYTGWIQSTGKKFDSSYDHGGQLFDVTPLGQAQIIAGWNQGLIGIKAGGTRRLIIPPALAYGAQGAGPIPPNATLIFDVTAVIVK